MPKIPRVYWSDKEREQVALEAVRLRNALQVTTMTDALLKAQLVLPEARRRPVPNTSAFARTVKQVHELERAHTAPAEPLTVPGQVLQVDIPRTPPVPQLLAAVPSSLLVASLCDRFFHWVERSQAAWLAARGKPPLAAGAPRPAPTYPVVPKERNGAVRIAFVGLLKSQFDHVVEKVGAAPVVLQWLNKEARDPSIPLSTDYVVVESHVRHAWNDKAKDVLGADRVRFAQGVTDCVQKVYDIISQQHG